eukprot:4091703-Amphidinium_carterae.1
MPCMIYKTGASSLSRALLSHGCVPVHVDTVLRVQLHERMRVIHLSLPVTCSKLEMQTQDISGIPASMMTTQYAQ